MNEQYRKQYRLKNDIYWINEEYLPCIEHLLSARPCVCVCNSCNSLVNKVLFYTFKIENIWGPELVILPLCHTLLSGGAYNWIFVFLTIARILSTHPF